MSIIVMASQCLTRPPKRAVRTLAFVAISFLSSLASAVPAGDTVTLDSSQYEALYQKLYSIDTTTKSSNTQLGQISDNTGAINGNVDTIRNHTLSIMGDASSISARLLQLYNWLYGFMPTVKTSIDDNGHKIDTTNGKLQSIIDFLSGERLGLLQNIESHSLGITQNTENLLNEFRKVVTDSSAVRVSFDPRVAVTNDLHLVTADPATNYHGKISLFPQQYANSFWASLFSKPAENAISQRGISTYTIPSMSRNFYLDCVNMLRYLSVQVTSLQAGDIKTVYILDGVTNRLDFLARDLDQFHNANTNLLVEIRDQDKTHYDSFEELKTAVVAWLESQKSESEDTQADADSQLGEINSYVPEQGSAPDTGLGDSDVSSYISGFDTLASVLESRKYPEQLQIRFGGWTLFGAEIDDKPIVISLSGVRPVFDALRMAFSLLWWVLSLFVLWWLIRLLVSLHHKIIEWTFTTTSGPQQ